MILENIWGNKATRFLNFGDLFSKNHALHVALYFKVIMVKPVWRNY